MDTPFAGIRGQRNGALLVFPHSYFRWVVQLGRLAEKNRVAVSQPHEKGSEHASRGVAEWAYEQTERARGQVGVAKDVFQHLGPGWRRPLVA